MATTNRSLSASNPLDDVCPICKSNRYLNPDLTFVINSECYHTMCTSCVDRLFTSGPAPCPVAGCHKTLRKRGFHTAFFGDLTIEREVDVRKRVGAVFNRREDEFESLRDFNNYLEEVENIVFEIVEGTPAEKRDAEARLKRYADENERDIKESAEAEREERERGLRRAEAEKEATRQRRAEAAREEEQTREEVRRAREGTLDALASGKGDAKRIALRGQKAISKTFTSRMGTSPPPMAVDLSGVETKAGTRDSGLTIRGLKKKVAPVAEKPYDAFGGLDLTPSHYVLQDDYANDWLNAARSDIRHMAGGYSLQEYYGRTMFEAFSGIGVFIEDELTSQKPPVIATGMSGVKASDDIF